MNKLVFNDTSYDVALNGINVTTDTLVATLVTDDFDEVEASVVPVNEIVQTLEDGTKVATYKGFTKLVEVKKLFNQIVDEEAHSHEETVAKIDPETGRPIVDPETGEIETEVIVVTDYTPVYDDVIVITLFQPTLENTVAEQGEEITEIQEIIDEILEG